MIVLRRACPNSTAHESQNIAIELVEFQTQLTPWQIRSTSVEPKTLCLACLACLTSPCNIASMSFIRYSTKHLSQATNLRSTADYECSGTRNQLGVATRSKIPKQTAAFVRRRDPFAILSLPYDSQDNIDRNVCNKLPYKMLAAPSDQHPLSYIYLFGLCISLCVPGETLIGGNALEREAQR